MTMKCIYMSHIFTFLTFGTYTLACVCKEKRNYKPKSKNLFPRIMGNHGSHTLTCGKAILFFPKPQSCKYVGIEGITLFCVMLVTFLQFLISDTNCIDIKNDSNGKLWPHFVIRVVCTRGKKAATKMKLWRD